MNNEDYKKLALKWAPIHYQYLTIDYDDVKKDVAYKTKTDLVVPVNLDGYTNTCTCNYRKNEHDLPEETQFDFYEKNSTKEKPCDSFTLKYTDDKQEWDTEHIRTRLEKTHVNNLIPVVYYSIAATMNYFYILYSFYHANDEKHPNDMEGCLVVIERDDKDQKKDRLVGMITVSHLYFPRYVYDNRLNFDTENFLQIISSDDNVAKNQEKEIKKRLNILGTQGDMEADEENNSTRSLTQQETQGHGFYALGQNLVFPFNIKRKLKNLFGTLDFIIYYPTETAKPYDTNDLIRYRRMPHSTSLYYELVDIHDQNHGLCHRIPQDGKENSTFDKEGKFYGGSAKPPWLWEENKEGEKLTLWDNPEEIAGRWFESKNPLKKFSEEPKYKKTMSQLEDEHFHSLCEFRWNQ